MRDWELVLYKYVKLSVLELSAPHRQVSFSVRVRYRRGTPTFAFFSLSLDPFFFFFDIPTAPLLFLCFITSLHQNCALSLYFTIIADTIRKIH